MSVRTLVIETEAERQIKHDALGIAILLVETEADSPHHDGKARASLASVQAELTDLMRRLR